MKNDLKDFLSVAGSRDPAHLSALQMERIITWGESVSLTSKPEERRDIDDALRPFRAALKQEQDRGRQ